MSEDRWEKGRFLAVVVLQLAGLVICAAPVALNDFNGQAICWILIGIAAGGAVLTMLSVLFTDIFMESPRKAVALSITVLYVIDIVMLTALMGLTGGPARSLYTPLMPILLTSGLLAEGQQTRTSEAPRSDRGSTSYKVWFYSVLAVFGVGISFLFHRPLPEIAAEEWAVGLLMLGILITPLVEVLPRILANTRLRWLNG